MASELYNISNSKQQPSCAENSTAQRAYRVIIRLPDVQARTGLSRATIYRKMQNAEFPRAHQLGKRAVGWLEADIDTWIANCIAGGANDQ